MINTIRSLIGSDSNQSNYPTATTDGVDLSVEQDDGHLVSVTPHAENGGMADMAGVLQSVHDVTTNWRGKNVSPAHSFELWYDGDTITFYFWTADERSADAFRRRVSTAYSNSALSIRKDGRSFPKVDADDHVAGATLNLKMHHFYPIRHRDDDEGFEENPYGVITSEMLGSSDLTVVVQVTFKPKMHGWADGEGRKSDSVDDIAESLREGTVVGWKEPRIRDAGSKEKAAAKVVEQQRGQLAFSTNINVLAASPDRVEAETRARGVGEMFQKYYNSTTEQGFNSSPVSAKQMNDHLDNMAHRQFNDHNMILTVDELASAAHIPNEEVETPRIDFRRQKNGGRIPVDNQAGNMEDR